MPIRFVAIFPLRWLGSPADAVLRTASRGGPAGAPLWRRLDGPPASLTAETGFEHLAPTVRALLGQGEGAFRMSWFALDPAVSGRLVGKLHPIDGPAVDIDPPSLVACPLGSGFLLLSGQGAAEPAADLVELVFRLRTADRDRRHPGWRLGSPPPEAAKEARAAAVAAFGTLAAALMGEPLYLGELVDWLVHGFAERSRGDAIVHVAATVPRPPDAATAERTCWHLGRGYSAAYQAPPAVPVSWPRGNRVLSLSRDGAAALAWAAEGAAGDFELAEFPRRFATTWLALHLLVLTEGAALADLSAQVQGRVGALSAARDPAARRAARDELGLLVEEMIRYSAAISTEDCGGLSDHVDFYDALRRVHGIHAQRAELRAEVTEIFGLVEARLREAEAEARERTEAIERLEARARELEREQEVRFQGLVGRIGVPALGLTVVSGLFGMNLTFPGIGFFVVVVATAVASLLLYRRVRRATAPTPADAAALARIRGEIEALRSPLRT